VADDLLCQGQGHHLSMRNGAVYVRDQIHTRTDELSFIHVKHGRAKGTAGLSVNIDSRQVDNELHARL